jgi:hypothetical protein
MIPEYKHDKDKPIDFETALEGMPEIAQQIAQQSTWAQYEQAPDLSDIPEEYQKFIPDNIRKQQEDTRIYNIWLTKNNWR